MAMPTPRAAATTDDPIGQFFVTLSQPGHLETFDRESATIRFDVVDGEATDRWHLTVKNGDVTVSKQNRAADAVVRVERPYFEAIVTGRMNAQAAMLRGLLTCHGSVSALMMFQRCLPGPPGSTGRVAPISSEKVMAQRRAS
jgi:putative sterol carrier protein